MKVLDSNLMEFYTQLNGKSKVKADVLVSEFYLKEQKLKNQKELKGTEILVLQDTEPKKDIDYLLVECGNETFRSDKNAMHYFEKGKSFVCIKFEDREGQELAISYTFYVDFAALKSA